MGNQGCELLRAFSAGLGFNQQCPMNVKLRITIFPSAGREKHNPVTLRLNHNAFGVIEKEQIKLFGARERRGCFAIGVEKRCLKIIFGGRRQKTST